MKGILRHYAIDTLSLYFISKAVSGLVFENGLQTLLLAGLGLSLVSLLAKPIINLLLLPINLVTFGLFRWAGSAIALYLVTLVVTGFRIESFAFGGFSSQWLDMPPVFLTGIAAFIAFSFTLSIVTTTVHWFLK